MKRPHLAALLAISIPTGIAAPFAHAQIPGFGNNQTQGTTQSTAGGLLGGALGNSALPNLGSSNNSNIAGVLSYCIKNNVVSSSSGSSVVSKLSGQSNSSTSSDYQSGSQGLLQTGSGNSFSLSTLSQPLKKRLCNSVLSHAKSLI